MHGEKVWIVDWKGDRHEMTPEELLERIRKDSKSNYNWLAPATEIVRTVTDDEFPEEIANELKIIVLTCFANILLDNVQSNQKPDDYLAVAYCYYTVHGKAGKKAKRLYRENIVAVAVRNCPDDFFSPTRGEQFRIWRRNWKKFALENFTELFGKEIYRWEERIEKYYSVSIKAAEEAGMFDEDREHYEKSSERLAQMIIG